jgi:SAM-dependent methyltransferase
MISVPCALCGRSEVSPFYACGEPNKMTADVFQLVRCDNCRLVYVNPRPDEKEMDGFYFREYYKKPPKELATVVGEAAGLLNRNRVANISRGRKSGRILDVGCGDAGFLAGMAAAGWEAWGVETSSAGAALASTRPGLRIHTKPLVDCGLPADYFDVITLWHSVEHLDRPIAYLKEARRLLKPDGVLFLALPNIDGLEFKVFKGAWFHLDLPRHVTQFNPTTASALVRAAGLDPFRINHYCWEYNPFGWLQSALNVVSREMNFFYRLLKGFQRAQPKPTTEAIWDWAVLVLLLPVLLPLSFAFSLVAAVAGRSGCFEIYASKSTRL